MCKITAPEPEPQRGTVIQTNPEGKIETVKDDQGLSRIVSREEFMNRPENQTMQRPDNQSGVLQQYSDKEAALMDMMSQVPRQAFGVPAGGDPDPRLKAIPTDPRIAADYQGALPGSSPQLAERYRLAGKQRTTGNPLFDSLDLFDEARYLQSGIPELANMPSLDPGEAAAQMAMDTGPSLAPPPMQPAADMPYTGIEQSLAREAQAGRLRNQSEDYKDFFFEEGLRMSEPNALENRLMDIRDIAQKVLGYDDGMRGIYQMEQDKKVAEKNYKEGQRQRDKDRNQVKKSVFDPCPEGFTYNPIKKVCEPDKKVEGEEEIGTKFTFNQAAPPDFLNYGKTGGEYSFFTEMPGVAKPNIRTMALGGKGLDSLPRAPEGETQGKIKEDKEGPFMLSGSEYVLPTEQIIEIGGGDYKKGIKALDKQRYAALRKYKDRVEQLKA